MADKGILTNDELLALIKKGGGGGGSTTNYNDLDNLPQINGNTVQGNMSTSDLGINEMSASVDENGILIFTY